MSESAWTVQDHGVHTAFVQQVGALRDEDHDVAVNRLGGTRHAEITIVHSPGPVCMAHLKAAQGLRVAMAHVTPETLRHSLRGERAWLHALSRWLKAFYSTADVVVAVSAANAAELERMGLDRRRIVLAPLGIHPVGGVPTAQRRRRLRILGVGQLQPRKGIEEFAAVAAACPDQDFVWAGGRPFGPLTAGGMVPGRLNRRAPANLHFLGRVTDSQLRALYTRSDAFLFLSRQENFGQVVVEAAQAGLPLFLSSIEPFQAHFRDAAMLVDSAGGASRLREACADRDVLEAMSARSSRLGRSFTAQRSIRTLLDGLDGAAAHGRVSF